MQAGGWGRALLRDAGCIVALLGIVEATLRLAAPIYGRQLFDNEYTGSFPIDENPTGYRGTAVPKEKAQGEVRILGLGDSTTFGTGVDVAQTWPMKLGGVVQEMTDRPVVAINGGVEGASLEDMILDWDTTWSADRPDVVVLALTGNMVSLEIARNGKVLSLAERYAEFHRSLSLVEKLKLEANRQIHRLCLPSFGSIEVQRALLWEGLLNHDIDARFPYSALLAHGWRQGDLDPRRADVAWDGLASSLGRLKEKVESAGASLIVTYLPPRFTLSSDLRDNQKNVPVERFSIDPFARARQIAEGLGLKYFDGRSAVLAGRRRIEAREGRKDPMYIYFDYAHLNGEGHRAVAEAVAAVGVNWGSL